MQELARARSRSRATDKERPSESDIPPSSSVCSTPKGNAADIDSTEPRNQSVPLHQRGRGYAKAFSACRPSRKLPQPRGNRCLTLRNIARQRQRQTPNLSLTKSSPPSLCASPESRNFPCAPKEEYPSTTCRHRRIDKRELIFCHDLESPMTAKRSSAGQPYYLHQQTKACFPRWFTNSTKDWSNQRCVFARRQRRLGRSRRHGCQWIPCGNRTCRTAGQSNRLGRR